MTAAASDPSAAEQPLCPSREGQTPSPTPALVPSAPPQVLGCQTGGPRQGRRHYLALLTKQKQSWRREGKACRIPSPFTPLGKAPKPQGKHSPSARMGQRPQGREPLPPPPRAGAASSSLFAHLGAGRGGEGGSASAAEEGGGAVWFPPPR